MYAQSMPEVSSGDVEYWYAIRFVSGAKCITATGVGEVTTADFTGDDAQLWKITGNGGDAGFAFTNKKGLILSVEAAQREMLVNAEETEICVSRFAITQNGYGHWEIRPKENNSLAMNFWGGTGEKVGLWDASPADDNNYVEFVEVFSSGDYVFTLTDGVYALAGYTGSETDIVLPDDFNGNNYVIGSRAFYGNTAITSVVIPEGVTSVGLEAFCRCSSLSTLEIQGTPTLQQGAFSRTGLKEVVLPEGITEIPRWCFDNSPNLRSVTIPSSVTAILDYAFQGCPGLTSIEIPNSVTSIGWGAFYGCSGLTSIEIHNGVTAIGNYAFAGCSNLTSIEIPNSVTTIGNNAFYGCTGLASIEIPNSVTSIGDEAFWGCSGLTSIEIPGSVTSIGSYAFVVCSGLTEIVVAKDNTVYDSREGCNAIIETASNTLIAGCQNTVIPSSVTSIGYEAFRNCSGLTSIEIPNSVTSIGNYAFLSCYNLTSIEIPNSVTSIGYNAFYDCNNLKTVYNNSALDIVRGSENHGFVGYYAERVINNVATIGYFTFAKVNGENTLLKYDYPGDYLVNETVGLEDWTSAIAGQDNGVDSKTFEVETSAGTVLSFDWKVSSEANYDWLRVYVDGGIALEKSGEQSGHFEYVFDAAGVHTVEFRYSKDGGVDNGSDEGRIYDVALVTKIEKEYALELPADYNGESYVIGEAVFRGHNGMTSVTIPAAVINIFNEAFYGCTKLKTVYNKSALNIVKGSDEYGNLGYYADVVVNANGGDIVTEGDYVFTVTDGFNVLSAYTGNATEIVLPDDYNGENYVIGDEVFKENETITSVVIPDGVSSIGFAAFAFCPSLESVSIPASVTSIGDAVFASCPALASILVHEDNPNYDSRNDCNAVIETASNTLVAGCKNTVIPSDVASIGTYAFYENTSLENIVIPEGVTNIGNGAFYRCVNLLSVSIPDGVVGIGSSAFYACSSLESVSIPASVTSVGDYAFRSCSSLVEVELEGNGASYGEYVFANCEALKNVTIAEGVSTIGLAAFYQCPALESVSIPASVTSIGIYAFYECYNLKTVYNNSALDIVRGSENNGYIGYYAEKVISNVVTNGDFTFAKVNGLNTLLKYNYSSDYLVNETVTIDDWTSSIAGQHGEVDAKTFEVETSAGTVLSFDWSVSSEGGCDWLRVYIDGNPVFEKSGEDSGHFEYLFTNDGVHTVKFEYSKDGSVDNGSDEGRIYDVALVTKIEKEYALELPADYNGESYVIGEAVFRGHNGMTSVTIPAAVINIFNEAFYGCTKLKTVYNKSALNIVKGSDEYGNLGYYADVVVNANGGDIVTEGDYVFTVTDGFNVLSAYTGNATEIVLPDDYNGENYVIGDEVFKENETITSVVIPDAVTSIGNRAFNGCSSLAAVNIPTSVASVGEYAFAECEALKNVTIADGVSTIGFAAFYQCPALESVSIPASVTSIGNAVFASCPALESIVVHEDNPNYDSRNACNAVIETASNTLVAGCKNTVIPSDVASIGTYAFYENTSLENIVIPEGVTNIGNGAFYRCVNLLSVSIPDGVAGIGSSAFYGCSSLESVSIPATVTSVGDYAFRDCSSLVDVELKGNGASYGQYVFANCGSLRNVTIAEGVSSIGYAAFYQCPALESVSIPATVTSVGDYAFANCGSLKNVTIADGVSSIGFAAFYQCPALESVSIPASVTSIGNAVFASCPALESIVVAEGNTVYDSRNRCNAIIVTETNVLHAGCKSTVIPEDVDLIWHYAFYGTSSLENIVIPEGVTNIGNYAFYECYNLKSIVIPSTVAYIYSGAFKGCNAVEDVYVYTNTVPELINDSYFENVDFSNTTLHVYYDMVGEFQSSGSWNCFGNYVGMSYEQAVVDGITYNIVNANLVKVAAVENAYSGNIVIPEKITYGGTEYDVVGISSNAFNACTGVTSVVIPKSVTAIGYDAFYGCENLATVCNFSNLGICKGSADYGYVAYYAKKVINVPGGDIVGDFVFAEIDGVNTLVEYFYKGGYNYGEPVCFDDWTSAIADQNEAVDSKTYNLDVAAGSVLSFDWKVSSESGWDWLRVYIDGAAVLEKSGEESGSFEYVFGADGTHSMVVEYSKDGSVRNGDDEGKIYDVAIVSRSEQPYTVALPDSYKGGSYVVGEGAFRGHDGMTSVTIPAAVVDIYNEAFLGCVNLNTVYNDSNLDVVAGSESYGYVAYYARNVIAGEAVPVSGITLDNTSITLTEGAALQLNATVNPANATNKNVTWRSSNTNAVLVNDGGMVTAVAEGTAIITATAGNYSAECEVTVEKRVVPVTGVTLDRRTVTLVEGESVTLVATVYPDNATDKGVVWTSANENVAIVEGGVVMAVASGTATITATAGNYSAECVVTVEKPYVAVAGIELDYVEATLLPGGSVELVATVYPDDATNKNVTWTSSAPSVATVRGGVVTAIAPGTARITAKAGNFSAFCEITVDVPYGVSLDKASLALFVGNSATLVATVNVAEGDDDTVTWTSSAASVATVENGVVKAVAPGTATITATAAGTTATCIVTVTKRPVAVTGIEINESRVTLKQGAKIALTATVEPADATNKSVTWTTSDEAVAKVNEEGVVTAVAEGTATITATAGEYSAKCRVTVTGPVLVTEVVLDIEEKTITEGKSFRLVATVGPDDADDKTVVWSTSDESVATVKDGVVTAVAPGYAVITATSGECSAECLVIVEAKYIAVRGIKLDKSKATVTEGETLVLVATVTPEDATDKDVEWTSSDEAVAVVEDGVVTAVAPGTVTITAKVGKYTAKCVVTVKKGAVAVTGITLSETAVTLVEYETMTLVATVAPDDADDKTVIWSTSDEGVVTVENGVITAVAPGVAVITAEASGFVAECTVTVEALSAIGQVKLDSGKLVIYDLNGLRIVDVHELKSGVYIVNGKTVLVK